MEFEEDFKIFVKQRTVNKDRDCQAEAILIYLTKTRLDIAFAVSWSASKATDPTISDYTISFVNHGTFHARSTKQHSVSSSSTEAEMNALFTLVQEII